MRGWSTQWRIQLASAPLIPPKKLYWVSDNVDIYMAECKFHLSHR